MESRLVSLESTNMKEVVSKIDKVETKMNMLNSKSMTTQSAQVGKLLHIFHPCMCHLLTLPLLHQHLMTEKFHAITGRRYVYGVQKLLTLLKLPSLKLLLFVLFHDKRFLRHLLGVATSRQRKKI